MIKFTPSFAACAALILLGVGVSPLAHAAPVALQDATATFSQTTFGGFPVSAAIDGILGGSNGWAIDPMEGTNQTAVFQTVSNVGFAGGTMLTFTMDQLFGSSTIGHFNLAVTTDTRSTYADGLAAGGNVTANWTILSPLSATSSNGATMTTLGDKSILVSGALPSTDIYTVAADTTLTGITGIRLVALTAPSLPSNGPGALSTNGNFVLTEFQVDAVPAVPEPETYAMLLAGLGLIGFTALRRKQNLAV
jgi:hypothetical protein